MPTARRVPRLVTAAAILVLGPAMALPQTSEQSSDEPPATEDAGMYDPDAERRGIADAVDALLMAAMNGESDVVQEIIDRVGPPRLFFQSPLVEAARANHFQVVEILLHGGMEVDGRDTRRQTTLMVAAEEGHLDVVHLLMQADADPALEDGSGATAEGLAAGNGHDNVVRAIREIVGR